MAGVIPGGLLYYKLHLCGEIGLVVRLMPSSYTCLPTAITMEDSQNLASIPEWGMGRGISADPKREAVADSYHAILCWPSRLCGSFVNCVVKSTVHLLCASHTVL